MAEESHTTTLTGLPVICFHYLDWVHMPVITLHPGPATFQDNHSFPSSRSSSPILSLSTSPGFYITEKIEVLRKELPQSPISTSATHQHLFPSTLPSPFLWRDHPCCWRRSASSPIHQIPPAPTQGHGPSNLPPLLHYQNFPSLADYFPWHVISPTYNKNKPFLPLLSLQLPLHLSAPQYDKTPCKSCRICFAKSCFLISLLCSLQSGDYPHHSTRITLGKITRNIHTATSNSQCSVFILHITGHGCSLPSP